MNRGLTAVFIGTIMGLGTILWEADDQNYREAVRSEARSVVEGGGIAFQAADNGGCDGSPPDRITFSVDRDDLKKIIKALKKARDIARFMGGKHV